MTTCSRRALVAALALAAIPAAARADRGAVTLDAGFFGAAESLSPGIGSGSAVAGSSWGGLLGVRYAVRNSLEAMGTLFYQAPVSYYHPNTTIATSTAAFTGTLQSSTSSWGATVGGRWVNGLVWRYFVGGEFGFTHRSFSNLDLINVSDPSNPQSYGLRLSSSSTTTALLVPVAGLEWAPTDHFSLGLAARAQVYLGAPSGVQFLVPFTLSYAWY